MTAISEEWRHASGFEKSYQVSSNGHVRSLDRTYTNSRGEKRKVIGRLLKPKQTSDGHLAVNLTSRIVRTVHSLVLLTFVGPRPPRSVCMHMNHVPTDNRLANLQYGTIGENIRMDYVAGTRSAIGVRNAAAKLDATAVKIIRASPLTLQELANIFEVNQSTIHLVKTKRTWTHVL